MKVLPKKIYLYWDGLDSAEPFLAVTESLDELEKTIKVVGEYEQTDLLHLAHELKITRHE
jgi:hypothetical protein